MGEQAVLSRLQQKAAKEGGVGGKAIGASATRGPSKASSKVHACCSGEGGGGGGCRT